MAPKHGAEVRPVSQIEGADQIEHIATDQDASSAKSVVSPRQIHALMAYYVALLLGCMVLIIVIIMEADLTQNPPQGATQVRNHLLASLGFLISGAIVGSVLYQIRMLYRFYIKSGGFDSRWVGKYISAPL